MQQNIEKMEKFLFEFLCISLDVVDSHTMGNMAISKPVLGVLLFELDLLLVAVTRAQG